MRSAVSPAVVEGYFIYIRRAAGAEEVEDEEDEDDVGEQQQRGRRRRRRKRRRRRRPGKFRKVTIIGHASHSFIFEGLKPGTMYEIKVQIKTSINVVECCCYYFIVFAAAAAVVVSHAAAAANVMINGKMNTLLLLSPG